MIDEIQELITRLEFYRDYLLKFAEHQEIQYSIVCLEESIRFLKSFIEKVQEELRRREVIEE